MKNVMIKRIIQIALIATIVFTAAVTAFAGGTVSINSVSGTTSYISFDGIGTGINAAVVVQILDSSNNILAMESFPVAKDQGFGGTINGLSLTAGTSYTVRIADYDGGAWTSQSVTATAITPAIVVPEYVISNTDKVFDDVKKGDYFYDAVQWAVKNGITRGIDATHFGPKGSCTRAQMVTFLWYCAGSPEPSAKECKFTDIRTDAYYYKAVLWAAENGLTSGTGDTTFSPNATCTRAQAICFIYRYAGGPSVSDSNPFTDVKTNDYFSDAVVWAVKNGITSGTSNSTFSPQDSCIRAHAITFLYKYLGK